MALALDVQYCACFMVSAIAVSSREQSARLSTWALAATLTALVALLYADVIGDLAAEWWTRPESSYGMLIPPFALYVAYLKRHNTLSIRPQPEFQGIAVTAAACLMLITGKLASEFFLSRISFVFLLTGLIWTFWGKARMQSVGFPLLLLMTMVPPPAIVYNAASAPLQLFASKVATDMAQMLGVSIFRDGNIIHLASTSLGVAEACSGLQSLSALMVAALLLGFLENASLLGRITIFVLSIPLAVAVNVLRVTGTAIIADSRPELALGYYHSFSGWLIFVIGFGMLWLIARVIFRVTRRMA
jgi:exosortase